MGLPAGHVMQVRCQSLREPPFRCGASEARSPPALRYLHLALGNDEIIYRVWTYDTIGLVRGIIPDAFLHPCGNG
jgi:hypothetical protein